MHVYYMIYRDVWKNKDFSDYGLCSAVIQILLDIWLLKVKL